MNNARRPPAVLGLGTNGYGHVRSLAREGVPVVYDSKEQFGFIHAELAGVGISVQVNILSLY